MNTVGAMESPEFVQTSLAGAMALGLERGSFYRNAYPGNLNLLMTYPDGCRANCSYCGLAKGRQVAASESTFIRVKWPVYKLAEMLHILNHPAVDIAAKVKRIGRVCVSMITHSRAANDCLEIVRRIKKEASLPVSVLVSPTSAPDVRGFFAALNRAGADRIGIAIDAATPEIFEKLRGEPVGGPHRWLHYWSALETAAQVFPRGHTSVHLIVGLGETEQSLVQAIAKAHQYGAPTHLFSFCPEPGSRMRDCQPPSLGRYRRLQLAAYLLNNAIIKYDAVEFDSAGRVAGYGRSLSELLGDDLAQGKPFMTSGCPNSEGGVACNRPYGNERPGPILRNYPFLPAEPDLAVIRGEIWHD